MGIQKEILVEGKSEQIAKKGDTVSVHYTGTFEDGKKFDSSIDRGQPFVFTIGGGMVIRGWDEGLVRMKIGEKAKFVLSSDYAYGDQGIGGVIPGGATLVFEIELLDIR